MEIVGRVGSLRIPRGSVSVSVMLSLTALLVVTGCSAKVVGTESYPVVSRQFPPEPVYSRVGLHYEAHSIPQVLDRGAPLIEPAYELRMPSTNLREAIAAFSKTLGYASLDIPSPLGDRRVSVQARGNADQVAAALSSAAGVRTELDHARRQIHVVDLRPAESADNTTLPPAAK